MNLPRMAHSRALPEVIAACLFWAFAFIAVIWLLPYFPPLTLMSLRFTIACFVMLIFFVIQGQSFTNLLRPLFKLFFVGVFLFSALGLQTIGLKFTTPSKSGFITVLYVVMLPIIERIFDQKKIPGILWVLIFMAMVGVLLISGVNPFLTTNSEQESFFSSVGLGEFLTLLCALGCALHIWMSERVLKVVTSPLQFHFLQSIWAMIFSWIASLYFEGLSWAENLPLIWTDFKIGFGMFELAVLSTFGSFLLMARAQKTIPGSTLGLLMLLESPFTMVFSVFLLAEPISGAQLFGAALILSASILETLRLARKAK